MVHALVQGFLEVIGYATDILVGFTRYSNMSTHYFDLIGSVFKKYSNLFLRQIMDYGAEFAGDVLDGKYSLFDPMVSDWSCQIRAIWLCCFVRTGKKTLSEEDLVFFGLVRLLCESTVFLTHEIVGSVPFKTKTSFWPEAIAPLKNKLEREGFYGEAKTIVAHRVLNDLSRIFDDIPHDYIVTGLFTGDKLEIHDELRKVFSFPGYTSFSDHAIPVLPFFHGAIVLFSLAAYFDVPLYNVTRNIRSDNDAEAPQFFVQQTFVDRFFYDASAGAFVYKGNSLAQPNSSAIVTKTYSFHPRTDPCDNNIVSFLNSILVENFSYIDFLYFIMSAHALLPKNRSIDWTEHTSRLMEAYATYGNKIGIYADTVTNYLYYAQKDELKKLEVKHTYFDILHMKSCSLMEVLRNGKNKWS